MIKVIYIAVGTGGSDVALLKLLRNLDRTIINPLVVLTSFVNRGLPEKLGDLGVEYKKLKYDKDTWPKIEGFYDSIRYPYYLFRRIFFNKIAVRKLIKIALKFKADIIHTNTGVFQIGYDACKKINIQHVWHIREFQDLDFNIKPLFSREKFLKKMNDSCNYNIAITNCIMDHFNLGNNSRRIYDGVAPFKSTKFFKKKDDYFLYVGALTENKGINELIDVFIEFSSKHLEYKLLIAGIGLENYVNKLKSKVKRYNLINRIIFLGERNDVNLLMQKATALIVPSKNEAFGLITAEAMFNGCLVIGKNTAGTKEQFDNGKRRHNMDIGLSYIINQELIHTLETVIANGIEFYYPLIEKAQETSSTLYSEEKNAREISILYEELLNSKIVDGLNNENKVSKCS